MCAQLDLEVRHKTPKKERRPSNFHEFRSKELHSKKHPQKKKTSMLECYNLLDPME
jgi:hypothetical protein